MEEAKPSYYAIIPAYVRYDKDLNPNAKLLYGEITALCGKEGYCWSSNAYFANLYDVSKVTVSRWISLLVEKGYILSVIIYKENSREVQQRRLKITDIPINKKVATPINKSIDSPNQKDLEPTLINDKDSITINNTNNRESSPSDFKSELIPKIKKDNVQAMSPTTKLKVANVADLEVRKESLRQEMEEASERKPNKYSKAFLNKFYKHYIRLNQDTGLMKFESDQYWDTNIQLSIWWENEKDPDVKSNKSKVSEGYVIGQYHNPYD